MTMPHLPHEPLICEPLERVRIELVGLGDRGLTALRLLIELVGRLPLSIVRLRDTDPQRIRAAEAVLASAARDCKDSAEPNLTYICTDWPSHARLAVDAMRAGRHVAVEVPAALTIDELKTLVATAQQTRRHCFMLENCCYDPCLLQAIRRIHDGEIGTPVHAEGTYYHRLGERWTPWRLEMNRRLRGDLYPTHELAPLCMALGITVSPLLGPDAPAVPTDSLATLVSMDTAPVTGPATYEAHLGTPAPDFQNGDHTTTLIRTAAQRTILLRHDVLTDMPYERLFHVVGTHGTITVRDDGSQSHDALTQAMNERLIMALVKGQPLDFSVQDMAAWCAVTPLSALSISQGFAPVPFPQNL